MVSLERIQLQRNRNFRTEVTGFELTLTCRVDSDLSALKRKALYSFEKSISTCESSQCHNLEDYNLKNLLYKDNFTVVVT
jgi:hypothetical protein